MHSKNKTSCSEVGNILQPYQATLSIAFKVIECAVRTTGPFTTLLSCV